MQRLLIALAVLASVSGLSACGTKGPLYLPEPPAQEQSSNTENPAQ